MKKVNHWANYKGPVGQRFTLPSLTVPDQTLSLHDLLKRYVRGQDVPVFEPVYLDDDSEVPVDLERMSAQDRVDLARAVRQEIKEKREALAAKAAPPDTPPASAAASPAEDIEGN